MAIAGMALHVHSQETSGIYYKETKVGYSRIIGGNVGNMALAIATFGLSSAKSNNVIEGETAELEITERKPVFTFVFGEDKQTGYIFSDIANMNDILLVTLHKKKGHRNLRTGRYGLTEIKTGIDEKDVVPIAIEKTDDSKCIVHPKKDLEKGEYCFYYTAKPENEGNTFNGVFDFSIK